MKRNRIAAFNPHSCSLLFALCGLVLLVGCEPPQPSEPTSSNDAPRSPATPTGASTTAAPQVETNAARETEALGQDPIQRVFGESVSLGMVLDEQYASGKHGLRYREPLGWQIVDDGRGFETTRIIRGLAPQLPGSSRIIIKSRAFAGEVPVAQELVDTYVAKAEQSNTKVLGSSIREISGRKAAWVVLQSPPRMAGDTVDNQLMWQILSIPRAHDVLELTAVYPGYDTMVVSKPFGDLLLSLDISEPNGTGDATSAPPSAVAPAEADASPAAPGAAPALDPSILSTGRDEVRIKPPEDWVRIPQESARWGKSPQFIAEWSPDGVSTLALLGQMPDAPKSVAELRALVSSQVRVFGGEEISASYPVVDGKQGVWLTVGGGGDGQDIDYQGDTEMRQAWILIPRKYDIVTMLFTAPAELYPHYEPALQEMLERCRLGGEQLDVQRVTELAAPDEAVESDAPEAAANSSPAAPEAAPGGDETED